MFLDWRILAVEYPGTFRKARKLSSEGQGSSQSSPLSSLSSLTSVSSVSCSPKSPEPITFSCPEANWPVKLKLPWGTLNIFTKQLLHQGKRLTPESKKDLIHKTVDAVRAQTHHATRPQFSTIAQRMVATYTDSLQDQIDDQIVGSGYDTILNKLVTRNQNLNRGSTRFCLSSKKRPLPTEPGSSSDQSEGQKNDDKKLTPRKDSYGCVKWLPEVATDKEKEMEEVRDSMIMLHKSGSGDEQWDKTAKNLLFCYPLQRRDIKGGLSLTELKTLWPYLLCIKGLLGHANELLGLDVRASLASAYTSKAPRLNRFFSNMSGKNEFIFEEARRQSSQDNLKAWLSAVILCVMSHFGEKDEELFYVVDETSGAADVEASSKTESPVLVVLGDSVLAGKNYMVMCDHHVLIPKCNSFMDSFSVLFASYYIFNLQYQPGAAATLEFIQRCFVGINPDKGSKGNQGKKKKIQMNPKVLKLINSLADFEWLEP